MVHDDELLSHPAGNSIHAIVAASCLHLAAVSRYGFFAFPLTRPLLADIRSAGLSLKNQGPLETDHQAHVRLLFLCYSMAVADRDQITFNRFISVAERDCSWIDSAMIATLWCRVRPRRLNRSRLWEVSREVLLGESSHGSIYAIEAFQLLRRIRVRRRFASMEEITSLGAQMNDRIQEAIRLGLSAATIPSVRQHLLRMLPKLPQGTSGLRRE